MGYLIVTVVAVAVAVFAMQNITPVDVTFIVWRIAQVPVAAVVLASLGAGLVIAGVPLWFRLWRARRRAASLESALEAARAAVRTRAAAPLTAAGPVRPPDRPTPPAASPGSTPR
jgi:uncharacterized integral membrane protein